MSRSTLYRAFPDREALLSRLLAAGVGVNARDTRARILAATAHLVVELGLQGTTIELIARAAGVAAVTIYRQFGDRDRLLAAALDEASPRRAARALALRDSADLEGDLARFAATTMAFIAEHSGVFRLALGAPPAEQHRLRELRHAPRGATASLKTWFARQIARRRLPRRDPRQLAIAFIGMLMTFAYIAPRFEDLPLEDPVALGRQLARLFLSGAGAAPARRR
jgi:AcrR family transcriptional regulator